MSSFRFPLFVACFLLLAFFLARARCLSAGLRYLRLTRLPRHDRGPYSRGIDPRLAVYARSVFFFLLDTKETKTTESKESPN